MDSTAGLATVSDVGELEDTTRAETGASSVSADADRVAAFLASDPVLDARLPAIEEKIHQHFGPEARIERKIFSPKDEVGAADEFHLEILTEESFDEKVWHLRALIGEEDELLAPVRPQLTIGIL